jgi:hypothetical protein
VSESIIEHYGKIIFPYLIFIAYHVYFKIVSLLLIQNIILCDYIHLRLVAQLIYTYTYICNAFNQTVSIHFNFANWN